MMYVIFYEKTLLEGRVWQGSGRGTRGRDRVMGPLPAARRRVASFDLPAAAAGVTAWVPAPRAAVWLARLSLLHSNAFPRVENHP